MGEEPTAGEIPNAVSLSEGPSQFHAEPLPTECVVFQIQYYSKTSADIVWWLGRPEDRVVPVNESTVINVIDRVEIPQSDVVANAVNKVGFLRLCLLLL